MRPLLPALAITLALGACTHQRGASSPGDGCERDDECVVVPRTCCGQCGAATPNDVRAVSRQALSAGRLSCESTGEDCLDCYEETDPRLSARCREGTCEVVDETGG